MTSTTEIIKAMLTENTGVHFLDSGGDDNRRWQRNQGVDFDSQPKYRAEFSICPIDGTLQVDTSVNLYHWMNDNLHYDADLQARFDAWVEERNKYTPWLVLMEEFAEEFSRGKPVTVNTYNEQSDLSQVVQYVEFCDRSQHETSHVLLQVHGGCDVRGGYTAPKCFRVRGDYYELVRSWVIDTVEAGEISWHWSDPGLWGDPDEAYRGREEAQPGDAPSNPLALLAFKPQDEVPPDLEWWAVVSDDGKATLYGKTLPQGEELTVSSSWSYGG